MDLAAGATPFRSTRPYHRELRGGAGACAGEEVAEGAAAGASGARLVEEGREREMRWAFGRYAERPSERVMDVGVSILFLLSVIFFLFLIKDGCWVDFVFNYFLFSILFIYNFFYETTKRTCVHLFLFFTCWETPRSKYF